MNRKFNLVWEQCIGYVKKDVEKCKDNNDKEMAEFYQAILNAMQNQYQRVKKIL